MRLRLLLAAAATFLLSALPAAGQPGPYYYGYGSGWYGPPGPVFGPGPWHRRPPPGPAVVIVEPAPVIVTQPAPVIVTQAAPTTTVAATPQAYCREYQTTTVVGGTVQPGYGTACQQPDGSWKIVATRP